MPGTIWGGLRSSMATSSSSGISWRRVLSNSSRVPRRHVYMTVMIRLAKANGTQPPSTTFSRLAARNISSIAWNGSINPAAAGRDQCQCFQITMRPIVESTSMVPVTAIPYAEASALDERNMATSSSTVINSSALTRGMKIWPASASEV